MKYLLAASAALLVLAIGAASASAAGAPGVTVLGEESTQIAVFKKAKCTKSKKSKSFYIDSTSTDGQYELSAIILNDFSGFHSYKLALEANASDYIRVYEKGVFDKSWSNEFVPPYPVPGFGEIKFTPNGKRVGLGFGPAMWNSDFSSAVVVAGGFECTYPKKKKGK